MRIQHNIAALNSHRQLGSNNGAVSKNLEKLSSGYRINRAGDDAAGLAISEKMRAQITGLDTASKNAQDGVSLIQTAEGALTEVHSMLNRMEELASQSANGTYSNSVDREAIQEEFTSLSTEITRISTSTTFNGITLLGGT
ncbi:MAG: flagellin, partial [Hungatella sp.]